LEGSRSSDSVTAPGSDAAEAPQRLRLRLVIVQQTPGVWLVRGLEHDVAVEGRSIGVAVRAALGFVQAHTAYDQRHDHSPLSAFPPAPSSYWHAYASGTVVSLEQLGLAPPPGWQIHAAVAHNRPRPGP
jgi:hypothetical protein